MIGNKKITITLIGIISILVIYTIISGNKSVRVIKNKIREITILTDSISNIHSNYGLLERDYKRIYHDLDFTRNRLDNFKISVESIMQSNINSVSIINELLNDLIDKQGSIDKLDTTDTFRIK